MQVPETLDPQIVRTDLGNPPKIDWGYAPNEKGLVTRTGQGSALGVPLSAASIHQGPSLPILWQGFRLPAQTNGAPASVHEVKHRRGRKRHYRKGERKRPSESETSWKAGNLNK